MKAYFSTDPISPCGILCLCSEPRCDNQLCAKQHCRLCDLPFDIENRLKPDGFLKTFCSCFLGESQALVGPQYPVAFHWMPMFYTVPCSSSEYRGSGSISSMSSESIHSLPQVIVKETVPQDDRTLLPEAKTMSRVSESHKTRDEKTTPSDLDPSVHNTSNLDTINISLESSHPNYLPVPPLNTTLEVDTVPENNFNEAEVRKSVHTPDSENEILRHPIQPTQRVNRLYQYQSYWTSN